MKAETTVVAPKTRSRKQHVYQRLRDGVVSGRIPPGTRLVHRVLAKELGTSTIPVIDALRQLEGEGLLVSTPGGGTCVLNWDERDLLDAFRIRSAHEGTACGMFAERATRADVEVLRECNRAYQEAVRAGDAAASQEADANLHRHIVRAARSPLLSRLVQNSGLVLKTISTSLPQFAHAIGFVDGHVRLLEALCSGDARKAEQAGRDHVFESRAYMYLANLNLPAAGAGAGSDSSI